MRKMRKQPVGAFNQYDFGLNAGDRVYSDLGDGTYLMSDLRESNGADKAASGVLSYSDVKKNGVDRLAVKVGELFYWQDWTQNPRE